MEAAGVIKGKREKIASGNWCTSTGKIMSLMIQF